MPTASNVTPMPETLSVLHSGPVIVDLSDLQKPTECVDLAAGVAVVRGWLAEMTLPPDVAVYLAGFLNPQSLANQLEQTGAACTLVFIGCEASRLRFRPAPYRPVPYPPTAVSA